MRTLRRQVEVQCTERRRTRGPRDSTTARSPSSVGSRPSVGATCSCHVGEAGNGHSATHGRVGPAPLVPVVAVEPVDLDVGDDHPDLLAGLPEERDPEAATHGAAPAVGPHDVARPQRAVGEDDGDAVVVRDQVLDARTLLDLDAVVGEPLPEHLLGAPLRERAGSTARAWWGSASRRRRGRRR